MQPSPPRAVPSLVHAPRNGRTGIEGARNLKRGEPLFEPSNPPSSRASRVRAGVEPRRLLRGTLAAGRNPQARRYRWQPSTLPTARKPHARVRALASRGGTRGSMRYTDKAGISLGVGVVGRVKNSGPHRASRRHCVASGAASYGLLSLLDINSVSATSYGSSIVPLYLPPSSVSVSSSRV